MSRFVGVVVPLPVLLVAFLVAFSVASSASETIEGCGRAGPRIEQGQTGLGMQESQLTVPMPDTGTWFSLPASSEEALGIALFICHVESGSSIVIDGRMGDEVRRTVGDASAGVLLEEIAANAVVETFVMTPPRTGDAGLKAR